MKVFSRGAVDQSLLEFVQHGNGLVSSSISGVDEVGEVGNGIVVVKGGVAQLLQQTRLQLYCDLLQLNDGNVVSLLKGLPKASQSSLLLFLNLVGGRIDALLQ